MTGSFQSMSHSKWDCKYDVVFIPKRRRKAVFGNIRKHLGAIFHELARQKECQIIEGHLMPDHVHMCIAMPPLRRSHSPSHRLWRGCLTYGLGGIIAPFVGIKFIDLIVHAAGLA
jgi:REP element-mobilizing transposase RayT